MFRLLFSLLILQRLSELVLAERNRRWALARGGWETGRGHYFVIVTVHTLFFLSLLLEWRSLSQGWNFLWSLWLALFLVAQALRFWTILSLGRFWNTRIIVVPGSAPVTRGPYRFIRHPNYVAIIIEMLAIPMLCGAYVTAAVFSSANALILMRRIPEEERALAQASGQALSPLPRFIPTRRSGFE